MLRDAWLRNRVSGNVPVLAAALLAVGCARPAAHEKPRDVLLITIDTARADRFSYAGTAGPGTPRIDAIARDGSGFLEAFSPVPLTKPAHASILTGRLPPSHSVRDNGAYRLPDSETTLAEVLRDAGFSTAAFVGAQVLDRRYGFGQGFSTYDDRIPDPGNSPFLMYAERRGEAVGAAAAGWLATRGEGRVFVWVHLFDPHTPYAPPEPERSRFASAYDGEIAYVDRVVGSLLDAWQARRGLERTLVVVTSDHGESLGEHGEATHGILVHDATLHVPLVIRAPGIRSPAPIREPVGLIDVMPTILSLLEIPCPPGVQGRDLTPLMRGGTVPWKRASGYAESLYAEIHHGCAPLRALREGGYKLIHGRVRELYDLRADPGEARDIAGSDPARASDLAAALEGLVAEVETGTAETVALDDDARRALQSLGYLWARPGANTGAAPLPDPREALLSSHRMAEADRSALRGDVEGAIAGYRAVLAVEPRSVDARVRLAQILVTAQRDAEALPLLTAAVAIAPQEPVLHEKLGDALFTLRRYPESLAAYDAGLALHPDERGLRRGRWRCLHQLGRKDALLAELETAIARDPSDGFARYARALACCGQGRVEDYVAALERELAALPGDPTLEKALAKARAEAASSR